MLTEALEGPATAQRLLAQDADLYAALSADLVADDPQALLTVARGSSDHAAHYMAYLVMARLGRLVTSLPMSLVTLYSSQLRCQGLVSLAFSQSGQSPDLIAPTRYFRSGGARTVFTLGIVFSTVGASCLALGALLLGRLRGRAGVPAAQGNTP
jgi:glucosamine--fructose-6-phosphate aminotransferase (isomerizing)